MPTLTRVRPNPQHLREPHVHDIDAIAVKGTRRQQIHALLAQTGRSGAPVAVRNCADVIW